MPDFERRGCAPILPRSAARETRAGSRPADVTSEWCGPKARRSATGSSCPGISGTEEQEVAACIRSSWSSTTTPTDGSVPSGTRWRRPDCPARPGTPAHPTGRTSPWRVTEAIDRDVERPAGARSCAALPLPLTLGGLLIFGGRRFVLARLVGRRPRRCSSCRPAVVDVLDEPHRPARHLRSRPLDTARDARPPARPRTRSVPRCWRSGAATGQGSTGSWCGHAGGTSRPNRTQLVDRTGDCRR